MIDYLIDVDTSVASYMLRLINVPWMFKIKYPLLFYLKFFNIDYLFLCTSLEYYNNNSGVIRRRINMVMSLKKHGF